MSYSPESKGPIVGWELVEVPLVSPKNFDPSVPVLVPLVEEKSFIEYAIDKQPVVKEFLKEERRRRLNINPEN